MKYRGEVIQENLGRVNNRVTAENRCDHRNVLCTIPEELLTVINRRQRAHLEKRVAVTWHVSLRPKCK